MTADALAGLRDAIAAVIYDHCGGGRGDTLDAADAAIARVLAFAAEHINECGDGSNCTKLNDGSCLVAVSGGACPKGLADELRALATAARGAT